MNNLSTKELADALFKKAAYSFNIFDNETEVKARTLAIICTNAYNQGIPSPIVQQLFKGTEYEQLLS